MADQETKKDDAAVKDDDFTPRSGSRKKTVSVLPFAVEVDLPRNGHLLIQSIPGRPRLRSKFDPAKPVRKGGEGPDADDPVVPKDQVSMWGSHPRTPGEVVYVDPASCAYRIIDPVHGDDAMCERVKRWREENSGYVGSTEVKGREPREGTLDIHSMKTLCRELYKVISKGSGKIIKGPEFSMEDVDELPGKYLLNPNLETTTSQPRFEEDLDEWVDSLNRMGV